MKILINNVSFDYNTGCRLLKLKYDECPNTIDLQDIWEDIVPMTFKEIATTLKNIEQRRVAIQCLGLERLTKEVKPVLINTKSIKKTTAWVNPNGELVTKKFTDTYELYKVKGEMINQGIEGNRWDKLNDVHFVKCKDTSTDRDYFIWVDAINLSLNCFMTILIMNLMNNHQNYKKIVWEYYEYNIPKIQ